MLQKLQLRLKKLRKEIRLTSELKECRGLNISNLTNDVGNG